MVFFYDGVLSYLRLLSDGSMFPQHYNLERETELELVCVLKYQVQLVNCDNFGQDSARRKRAGYLDIA